MKSVHELNENELEELRHRYILEFDLNEDNTTLQEVVNFYESTFFVEEDFFCNL